MYRAQPEWARKDAYQRWCALLTTGEIVDEYGRVYSINEMIDLALTWDTLAEVLTMYDGQYEDAYGHRFDINDFC